MFYEAIQKIDVARFLWTTVYNHDSLGYLFASTNQLIVT